jgi:hypothetical protein
MGELTATRWTRYGKDRLYLKDAAGADAGWVDLLTGELNLRRPELAEEAAAMASQFGTVVAVGSGPYPAVPHVAPTPPAAISPSDPSPVAVPAPLEPAYPDDPWHDLALNRPGQAARQRAEEELAAMRERSRVGTWIARTLDMKTDERAWRVGADGEETIGAKLEKLTRDGWYVLHSVPVGTRGSDIDHIVIGPGGVFTVNTKKHPGKKVWVSSKAVLVDGHRTDYLRNSRHEAERASRLLSAACGFPVPVKAVLIFTTATLVPDVTIKSRPDDVGILDRMDVPRAFKRADPKLPAEQVERIYAEARRSTTWSTA